MKKIVFITRADLFEVPGGDTTQVAKTKEFLENSYGLDVQICTNTDDFKNHCDADIVHIFDMREDNLKFIDIARNNGQKVAISTIYWDLTHAGYVNFLTLKFGIFPSSKKFYGYKDLVFNLSNFRKILTLKTNYYFSKKYKKTRQTALNKADLILPNSGEEIKIACRHFELDIAKIQAKTVVVPNAVDINLSNNCSKSDLELDKIGKLKDFVLQVARIEPIKNQLNVLLGLMDLPEIPVVFVGAFRNKRYGRYFNKLKKLADKRGNVYFIDQIPHEQVFEYYKRAKVHVLPSFRESTGLSSLEALVSGCEIIVTDREYVPVEYYEFDKYGHICDPYDPESIKQAVLNAFKNKKNNINREEYLAKFSYNATARETFRGYEMITRVKNAV